MFIKKNFFFKALGLFLSLSLLLGIPSVNSYAVTSAGNIARGIDVSKYQGTINWSAVAQSGIKFAFIRVGTTKTGMDPTFHYNMVNAQANGIKTGVYIYSYATNVEQAAQEAALVIQAIAAYPVQMPVVFDIEDKLHKNLPPDQINAIINTFCAYIDAAGYYPMVYSYKNFFTSKIGNTPWDKWVAQFDDKLDYPSCAFWQNSSKGAVSGISGYVDLDYQYKDYSKLIINEGFLPHGNSIRFYRNYKMQRGLISYDNGLFMFDEAGNMYKGWYASPEGALFYFTEKDGRAAVGPTTIQDYDFFFNENGLRQVGFIDYGLGLRFYDPVYNGAMAKTWFTYNNAIYHADSKGNISTGYTLIDKVPYFFDESGVMLTNAQIEVEGVLYMAGPDGILTEVPAELLAPEGETTPAPATANAATTTAQPTSDNPNIVYGVDITTLDPATKEAYLKVVADYEAALAKANGQ